MRLALGISLLVATLAAGCASAPHGAAAIQPPPTTAAEHDAATVAQCAQRMEHCYGLMERLRSGGRRHAEFLMPRDQDLLEHSLAEYLRCRQTLKQIAAAHDAHDAELSRLSRKCRQQYDVSVVSFAAEDPVLWRAMNQSFHRSSIPRGSCDEIVYELTATPKASLANNEQERVGELIRRRALLLPGVENDLRHTPGVQLISSSGQAITSQLSRGQNLLVTATGRLKNPTARTLAFTVEQRARLRATLLPGDILLTYTAGYASNLFVPGNFKHAATFVGTEEERRRVGYPRERLLAVASPKSERLVNTLAQGTTASGEVADVVESVAEGVLLINFDKLLTTRINRLLVLRPRLADEDRAHQLADVFSYVGDEFDFSFDLTDASDQVCTEVVYRSLQGRGGIDLTLANYAGRLTLPPDEILKYAAKRGRDQFECVLIVDESQEKAGAAQVIHGAETSSWIDRLLGATR